MKQETIFNIFLVAKVLVLQRKVSDGSAYQLDGSLQIVAFTARYAHRVALYAGLHFHFTILDKFDDFFRQFNFHSHLDGAGTFNLVTADLLNFIANLQALDVNASLGEFSIENILNLVQLKFIISMHGEH